VRLLLPALATLLFVAGCHKEEPAPSRAAARQAGPPAPVAPLSSGRAPEPERIDLLKELSRCEIEHHGRLLDFGGAQQPSRGFSAAQAEPPPSIDRGGGHV
jgi:hypothetical protein